MARRYTLQDIARLAGVSKTTVLRVIHQRPDVHPATRRSIVRIMTELGFVINTPLAALTRKRPHVIGVVVPSLARPFTHEIVHGVAVVLEPRPPYELVVCSRLPNQDGHTALDALLDARLIAGLVVILPDTSSVRLTQLSEQGFPMVLIDYHEPMTDPFRMSAEPRATASHAALALPALVLEHDQMAWDRLGAHESPGSRMLMAARPTDEEMTLAVEMRPPFTAAEHPFQEMGQRAAQLLLWQAETAYSSRNDLINHC